MAKMNYLESAKVIAQRTRTTRVVRFFPNSDLRSGHVGLRKVAQDAGLDPWDLSPGEFLVFANTKQTMLKIYAPGNLIAHLKSPDERRLDLNVIRYLPRFFNGTEFKYDQALREAIKDRLAA